MRFVIQRVSEASVTIDGMVRGAIGKGFMVLIGIENQDTNEIADKMIKKLLNMRIFEDEQGKTNLALTDVDGELLLISQFTLYADCKKGNRPSFRAAISTRSFPPSTSSRSTSAPRPLSSRSLQTFARISRALPRIS